MGHTPAPWIWADDHNLYEAAPWKRWHAWAESPESNLEDMPHKPDAIITTDSGVYGPHGDDAPLIAAAPELLACLRRMCGMYGAYSRRLAPLLAEDEGTIWTFERANDLALEAIAKAEGR